MSRGIYGRRLYWRATMLPARMLIWDARLAPLAGLVLLHFRLWTVLLLAVSLLAALWAERRGLSAPAAGRAVRSALAGRRRRATIRRPRPAVSFADECRDGRRWDPALLRPVPPPRWQRRADHRLKKLAAAASGGKEPR